MFVHKQSGKLLCSLSNKSGWFRFRTPKQMFFHKEPRLEMICS